MPSLQTLLREIQNMEAMRWTVPACPLLQPHRSLSCVCVSQAHLRLGRFVHPAFPSPLFCLICFNVRFLFQCYLINETLPGPHRKVQMPFSICHTVSVPRHTLPTGMEQEELPSWKKLTVWLTYQSIYVLRPFYYLRLNSSNSEEMVMF